MSNETVVIQQTNLFLNVSGRRITALPDTGTIATMEKLTPESALLAGLHKTAAHVISGSDAYRFTVNVLPMSEDDAYLFASIQAIRTFGRVLGVSLKYENTNYVSGSATIEAQPTRNFNADSVEFLAYPMIGIFQVARVGKFVNPSQLTADEIMSLTPA
jgi:hypothetical protein